jgi:hypothetical protein
MKFDSNRAWADAMAAVRANREVLLALGGVFFLLPTLLSTVFLTDLQTQMMETMSAGKPQVLNRLMMDNAGLLVGFGVGGMLVQMIGYLSVTALISSRGRPTVGESIGGGLRALPSLFAVAIVGFLGLMLATVVFSMLVVGLFSAVGAPAAGGVLAVVLLLLAMTYASVKLSLVVPVIVNEGIGNPIAAMVRSWKLTRRNSLRLFGFYTLLMMGYFAIALVATFIMVGPVMLVLGQGNIATLIMGLVSGAIGAVASIVFAAVLSETHDQLAGPSPAAVADLFE